jgi:hypothetical protein
VEGGVRCELVSKGSWSDEFLGVIKRGPNSGIDQYLNSFDVLPGDEFLKRGWCVEIFDILVIH